MAFLTKEISSITPYTVLDLTLGPTAGDFGGLGVCVYTASTYEGELELGLRHGHGTFRGGDGASYTGEWKHGTRHGKVCVCFTSAANIIVGQAALWIW